MGLAQLAEVFLLPLNRRLMHKKKIYINENESNDWKTGVGKDVANLQTKPNCKVGSGASDVLPRTRWLICPWRSRAATKNIFFFFFFNGSRQWQQAGRNSNLSDTLRHTWDTWMTVLQINECVISLYEYGCFYLAVNQFFFKYSVFNTRTDGQEDICCELVWSQVNNFSLL